MDAHALGVLGFDAVRQRLAAEASTEPGRKSARELTPQATCDGARWLQDETTEMRRAIGETGRPPVDGAEDLTKALAAARIEGHPLEAAELLAAAASLRAARAVLSWATRITWDHPRLDAVTGNLRPEPEAERKISAAFDETGQVADGASPDLADIRRRIKKLEDRIRRRMDDILAAARTWLSDGFYTIRNGRYVLPVRAGSKTNVPGIVHDSSDSGVTVYLEPETVVPDGNDLVEARAQERAEIRRILTALTDIVRGILPSLETNQRALAALDLAAARARFAERWKCVRAEIDEKGMIALEQARHPMLLFQGIDAVPIDLTLGDEFKILVITGPNTGGKTVALKTVGLIHLMALAGLPVPAKLGAKVGWFTNIAADIGDEQSIEQSLSTFSAHLRRISEVLRVADAKTLVLLDELGAGTAPDEGGALGCAILETLLARGARAVATTHLNDIKSFAASTPGVANGSVLFDVDTLRPTYRLEVGIPGRSHAFAIARRLGLDEAIVARAEAFVGDRQLLLDKAIGGLSEARDAAEKHRAKMEKALADAQEAEARAKRKIQEAVEEKRAALEAAAKEAADLVGGARAELERAIAEVRGKQLPPQEARQRIDKAHRRMAEQARALERPGTPLLPAEVRPGLAVHVRSLGADGTVVEVREKKGRAAVTVGGMEVEVPLDDLVRGESAASAPPPSQPRFERAEGPREIDLRGQRVEEAMRRLGREVDAALRAGLESVRVIHGFGTGALGAATTEWLRKHPGVSHFRTGNPDEGGGGVLVVNFR